MTKITPHAGPYYVSPFSEPIQNDKNLPDRTKDHVYAITQFSKQPRREAHSLNSPRTVHPVADVGQHQEIEDELR